jgi:hypothetical protein
MISQFHVVAEHELWNWNLCFYKLNDLMNSFISLVHNEMN